MNLKEEESYRLRRAPVVWRVNRQSIEKKREGVLSPPYEQGNEFERPPLFGFVECPTERYAYPAI